MTNENLFSVLFGALCGIGSWAIGLPWQLLYLWLLLMIFDILSGIIGACIKQNFSSKEMKFGLFRKVLDIIVMVSILTIQRVASLNGFDVPIGSMIVGAFCVKEITSIIENYGKAGGALPKVVKNWLKVLGQKIDGDDEDGDDQA
jgi:toxin secretion/phage lysis holin